MSAELLVYDYDKGESMEGTPHPDLTLASFAEEPTGAVYAYYDGGMWYHVPAEKKDTYEKIFQVEVKTVYVQENSNLPSRKGHTRVPYDAGLAAEIGSILDADDV